MARAKWLKARGNGRWVCGCVNVTSRTRAAAATCSRAAAGALLLRWGCCARLLAARPRWRPARTLIPRGAS